MPALVVALEELKSLRNLVISWGRVTTALDSGRYFISLSLVYLPTSPFGKAICLRLKKLIN